MPLSQTQRVYCQEQLLIPGSSAYYAWRFTSPTWQDPWLVLACLQQTLWRIAIDYKERSIAEAKLAWWQDEIQRLGLGQPEHPITQALLASMPEIAHHLGLLMEWVAGYQGAVQAEHVCTDADFALWARRLLAIPSLLLRAYHRIEAPKLIALINQQSELALFDINLQRAKTLYHRGQLFIPLQRLQAAGIDPQNYAEFNHQEALHHLYQTWFTQLYKDYSHHWQSLHHDAQKAFHYPHSLTRIHLKRCARFLKKPQAFGSPVKDLTPLSKLWLAR